MKDKIKLEIDRYYLGIIINSLREFRNAKIKEKVSTDSIDELYLKFAHLYERKCPLLNAFRKEYGR